MQCQHTSLQPRRVRSSSELVDKGYVLLISVLIALIKILLAHLTASRAPESACFALSPTCKPSYRVALPIEMLKMTPRHRRCDHHTTRLRREPFPPTITPIPTFCDRQSDTHTRISTVIAVEYAILACR